MANCAFETFAALFSPYEALYGVTSLRFEIRCRVGKGQKQTGAPPREWFPLNEGGYAEAANLVAHEGRAFDCYVGVLPRLGDMGTSDYVCMAAALWASVDNNDAGADGAINLIKAAKFSATEPLPPPHLAVASGGGVHCCWMLDELRDVSDVEARRQFGLTVGRLARCIGGEAPGAAAETNAAYPSYMIRVPGSFNHKAAYGEPRRVLPLRIAPDALKQRLVWWRAHLPPEPVPEHVKRAEANRLKYGNREFGKERVHEMPARALALINTPAPPSKRHDIAVEIAAVLFAAGWGKGATAAVLDGFAANNSWRLEKNELEYIVRHFERKQPIHA